VIEMRDEDWMAAMAAAPDDDLLRRRFAGALAAAGDPWAELVALQLDRAGGGAEGRGRPRRDREAELIERFGARWSAPLAAIAGVREVGFARGAPARLVAGAEALEQAGERIAAFPIEHLDVTALDGDVALLERYPGLARLVSLGLADCGMGDDGACRLASLDWPRLRWLDLAGNRIAWRAVECVAAAPGLGRLAFLGLERTGFDPRERPSSVDWDGTILALELPAAGAELVARHGERAWLRWPGPSYHDYPPRRE
jgi:hypothetical protein